MRFQKAIKTLAGQIISTKLQGATDWAAESDAIRQSSFFSAWVGIADILQTEKQHLLDFLTAAREPVTLPDGTESTTLKAGSRAKFVADMKERFGWGPDDGGGSVRDKTSTTRLELIYTTKTHQSYGFGQYQEGSAPDIVDAFPAARFVRFGFVQEPREYHEQHRDEVRLKSDIEFWVSMNDPDMGGFGVPYPPFGYNSQMGMIDVSRAEAEDLGLIAPGEPAQMPMLSFVEKLSHSVAGLDEEARAALVEQMGAGNVEIVGDRINWIGGKK